MASDYKEMDSEKKSTQEEYGTGQGWLEITISKNKKKLISRPTWIPKQAVVSCPDHYALHKCTS